MAKYKGFSVLEEYSKNIVVSDTEEIVDEEVAGYKYTYTIEKNEAEDVTATKTKENTKESDNVIETDTTVLFPVLDSLPGDANGDGKINVRDAAAIAKFIATGKK